MGMHRHHGIQSVPSQADVCIILVCPQMKQKQPTWLRFDTRRMKNDLPSVFRRRDEMVALRAIHSCA
jgi:hypothetical protein